MIQQDTHAHPLVLVSIAAPEDTTLLTQWEAHLRPLEQAGFISVWSEGHLTPGINRVQEFQHHVDDADLVVVLLSADFFSSPECLAMISRVLERAHEGKTRVIPLLLRSVAWQESPLGTLAPWPPNGKPIMLWSDQDEGWHACVQELRRLLGRRVSEALPSERSAKQADPDWERMLRRLRRSYKELLDQSLHGIAWVELGLSTRPDLVRNVTTLLFRLPDGGERLLPPGTKIVDAYDEAEEELLILGAPGAGKSTLLLDLAQQLVDRALADSTHPLPVILRLSSWALRRPSLEDWMVEQLSRTYNVPRKLSEQWVQQGCVLPLLDGLDEMEENARPACIAAINRYHSTHLTPLVICSRRAEYEGAASRERLVLQSAVIVQPLSNEQINAYLSATGPAFVGVRAALSQEQALRELATTPLMLSVLLLTYRGVSAAEIIQRGEERERQVWTDYVQRLVREKGNGIRYPLERTQSWLTFLAQQLRAHQQTIFYAENLLPDWLSFKQQRTATSLVTYMPALLLGACANLLVLVFLGEGEYSDFVTLVVRWGLVGGCIGIGVCQYLAEKPRQPAPRRSPGKRASRSLGFAVLFGVLLAMSWTFLSFPGSDYSFSDWMQDGGLVGLGGGLGLWLFQTCLSSSLECPDRRKNQRSFWQEGLLRGVVSIAPSPVWRSAAYLGGAIGLSDGLGTLLNIGPPNGLGVGLIAMQSSGLSVSATVVLIYVILKSSTGPLRLAERISWKWRHALHRGHLRTSLTIMGILFLFFGLIGGLDVVLSDMQSNDLGSSTVSSMLSHGLSDGLGTGLSLGLSYLILLGLYRGIIQEHLEDQSRLQFNQGIRRSLRNGLLLALISTSIITILGVLSIGLSNGLDIGLYSELSIGQIGLDWLSGLNFGLNSMLNSGLTEVQVFFSTGLVVMWALSGGLTVLRHYVIRWLLARHHTFPFRAQTFLDDATTRILLRRVSGGYSFIHRRLQDYFADTAAPTSEN